MLKNDGFMHSSENVDFDTPISVFFFGFVTGAETRPDSRGYAIPPTLLDGRILLLKFLKTMGFCTFQKLSILTPLCLSFSLVFFLSVTGAETRPDLPR